MKTNILYLFAGSLAILVFSSTSSARTNFHVINDSNKTATVYFQAMACFHSPTNPCWKSANCPFDSTTLTNICTYTTLKPGQQTEYSFASINSWRKAIVYINKDDGYWLDTCSSMRSNKYVSIENNGKNFELGNC